MLNPPILGASLYKFFLNDNVENLRKIIACIYPIYK